LGLKGTRALRVESEKNGKTGRERRRETKKAREV